MSSKMVGLWIEYTWTALGIVWLITMPFTKRAKNSQANLTTLFQRASLLGGFFLVCSDYLHQGWLGRSLPLGHGFQLVGLLIAVLGCAFSIWARLVLGSNWSGFARIREDHVLVIEGPYRFARHPIYTGILFACAGTTFAYNEWRCVFGSVTIALGLMLKMSQEERLLMNAFPEIYAQYRHRVKALIPGVF